MTWMRGSGIAAGCGAPGSTVWKVNSEKRQFRRQFIMKRFTWSVFVQASLHRVFAAYVDTRAREVWSAPRDTAEVHIVDEDVRTGG
jgi:hypothetical protein